MAALAVALADLPAWASSLAAWRVTRAGQLELRTAQDVRPQVFFEAGTALRGPRVWVDLPGAPSPSRRRTLRGGGALREVRIGRSDGLTTRLVLEFAPGTQLQPAGLRLVGTARDRWLMELPGLANKTGPGLGEGDLNALEKIQPLPARPPSRFEASLDSLVRDGVVSPAARARIRSSSGITPFNESAYQQACRSGSLSPQECSSGVVSWRGRQNTVSGPTIKPLSQNEQAVLQRIRSSVYTPKWRTYGQCKYDWGGWKLHSNGTRSTEVDCGGSPMRWTVGVSCDRLLVAAYTTASGWSKWREPAGPGNKSRQGEDEMVAALCANV